MTSSSPARLRELLALAESGLFVALALVFEQLRLFTMPNGGAVTLAALPIMVLAWRRGVRLGLLAGAVFGVLLTLFKPDIRHPAQFVLDYPLAHALLGLAGVAHLRRQAGCAGGAWLGVGVLAAETAKLSAHTVAGAVFFRAANQDWATGTVASLVYNATHTIPETVLLIGLVIAIRSRRPDLLEVQY